MLTPNPDAKDLVGRFGQLEQHSRLVLSAIESLVDQLKMHTEMIAELSSKVTELHQKLTDGIQEIKEAL